MRFCALLCIFFAAACSGGGDDTLHLDGYDVSARQMQLEVRTQLLASGPLAATVCRYYDDMTVAEAVDAIKRANPTPGTRVTPEPTSTPPKGAVMRPGQVADKASFEKATSILLGECKRLKS